MYLYLVILLHQVFDNLNKRSVPGRGATSSFKCSDAANENWDWVKFTGGYSPRNEVFSNAVRFIDMWKEMIKDSPTPHSKLMVKQLKQFVFTNSLILL